MPSALRVFPAETRLTVYCWRSILKHKLSPGDCTSANRYFLQKNVSSLQDSLNYLPVQISNYIGLYPEASKGAIQSLK